jgi:hypothetical protein
MEAYLRSDIVIEQIPFIKYGQAYRLVDETDAGFINQLRTNSKLGRFLSKTEVGIDVQRKWIEEYKKRELMGEDFYFMCLDPLSKERMGVMRLYNFSDKIFEIGSWLFKPGLDITKAIVADITGKEIGFDLLGYSVCKFEVRKENKSVIRYHQNFQPELVDEDELNYYYRLTINKFNNNKNKLLKIAGYGPGK